MHSWPTIGSRGGPILGEWTLFVEVERMTTAASLARKLVVNDEPSITDAVL